MHLSLVKQYKTQQLLNSSSVVYNNPYVPTNVVLTQSLKRTLCWTHRRTPGVAAADDVSTSSSFSLGLRLTLQKDLF